MTPFTDSVREFGREWVRAMAGIVLIVGFIPAAFVVLWVGGMFPMYVGAYLEFGQLPWEAGLVPLETGEPRPYILASYAWIGMWIATGIALFRMDVKSNGGDTT